MPEPTAHASINDFFQDSIQFLSTQDSPRNNIQPSEQIPEGDQVSNLSCDLDFKKLPVD